MLRAKLTHVFLWISVLGSGIGLGAKLFDILVLARAWSASPPASLALYPYGHRWPFNPGDFFQPLSAVVLVGVLGALISGWKTRFEYRVWLWVPVLTFLIVWTLTPTVFWPMINDLYVVASGKIVRSDAEVIDLTRRWLVYDWFRTVVILVGFIASVRAISMPYPHES